MNGLTIWLVGQLDEPMHEIFSNFRSNKRKVDGKVSRKWEQTHARVVVEFFGPEEESLSTQFPAFRI